MDSLGGHTNHAYSPDRTYTASIRGAYKSNGDNYADQQNNNGTYSIADASSSSMPTGEKVSKTSLKCLLNIKTVLF